MELTPEQQQALSDGRTISIVIGRTPCVVLRQDVYDLSRKDVPLNDDELRAALARSWADSDWRAPEMDVYDNYDAHRP